MKPVNIDKMMPSSLAKQGPIKLSIFAVVTFNLLSLAYFMGSAKSNARGDDSVTKEQAAHKIVARSERFVPSRPGIKTIHVVKEAGYDWQEPEFKKGFADCPHFANCAVVEHTTSPTSPPTSFPSSGDAAASAVVMTAQAAAAHPNPAWWARANELRSMNTLWVLHSMLDPYHTPLTFLEGAGLNLTMTYKPDSDIFTPLEFWMKDSGNKVSPRMVPRRNFAEGKTRKALWVIDGNCHSINNRMKYAKELSKSIAVDIIGECTDAAGKVHKIDYSTHGNKEQRRGVVDDYKFMLAFEEISCRDYITDTFFDAAKKQNVIPVVMGAQKDAYELVAPAESFIHIDDFDSPLDLSNYLLELDHNDKEFNAHFAHVEKGGKFEFPISAMCRLCDYINYFEESGQTQHYNADQFSEFWTPDDCNLNSLYKPKKRKSDDEI